MAKKKKHKIGTISDSELKKRVRKPTCKPGYNFRSEKQYKRNKKIEE